MNSNEIAQLLNETAGTLSETKDISKLYHRHRYTDSLPSGQVISEIVDLCRAVIFPGYYGKSTLNAQTMLYTIGVNVERIFDLLTQQVKASLNFCNEEKQDCSGLEDVSSLAMEKASRLVSQLPAIRLDLASDVEAAYLGDPAAESYGEVISCYPVIKALTNYRIAHELYKLGVPLLPRILTEMAHSETGIDIHPGAEIGRHFMIDHGTGVVVGETSEIGDHVKIYQGVTIGALSTRGGQSLRGKKRHPTIEDGVTIYAGASILGGNTVIGKDAVIGSNAFITTSVAPGTRYSSDKNIHS